MQNGEAPPGAIIPARVGEIGFDLPDDWWLMRGKEVNKLDPDKWEATSEIMVPDPTWCGLGGWVDDIRLIVRRRTPTPVTIEAMPGDRIMILSQETAEGICDRGYDRPRSPQDVDALFAALNNAVVVE